jgi:uracil-DNA glycosylase
VFPQPAGHVITATVHPSSILRAPDPAARETEMAAFTEDLRQVAKLLA